MIHLLGELRWRIEADTGPVPWVEPNSVVGFDRELEFHRAKQHWFRSEPSLDLSESPVEVIPDYIDHYLSRAASSQRAVVDGERFLDAVLWLVRRLGSSYAVGTLAVWRELVQAIPAQAACEKVLVAIAGEPEPFVRDILRNVIRDFFDVGGAWPGWQERMRTEVEPGIVRSIEALMIQGYETIDNVDARRFADGTPRL
ncbi:MAG: hypothetical protein H6704_23240 [Myxococcales bacterium]|nr:hypothetical protein [Myxococcales bacterium]